MAQPLLSIRNVSKRFASHLALDDVSLDIAHGEFISLLGPSGCGKTTLLRLIAGFMQPDAGSISIQGQEMTGLPPNRRPLNTVFQNYALFPHMSVLDNVAYGPRRAGRGKAEAHEAAADALRMVGLEAHGSRMPRQLSGGQQQRVALARAIVNRPKLLLLDEPLSALDMQLRKRMQIELKQLQQQLDIAFIFVTHDQEEAMSMSDRIAVLSHGRVEQVGDGAQIYRRPANRFVAGFIGEASLVPVARDAHGVLTLLPAGSAAGEVAVIRPEHVMLGDTAGADIRAEARVTAIVPIGGATSVHLDLAGNEIVARRLGLPDAQLRPGMQLPIGIASADIHVVSGAA